MMSNQMLAEQVCLKVKFKQQKRALYLYNILATFSCLCIVMTLSIGVYHAKGTPFSTEPSIYASIAFLGEGMGGFLVVGIASFTIGVLLTVFCLWRKQKTENSNKTNEEEIDW